MFKNGTSSFYTGKPRLVRMFAHLRAIQLAEQIDEQDVQDVPGYPLGVRPGVSMQLLSESIDPVETSDGLRHGQAHFCKPRGSPVS
jgi:hypothetical protein